MGDDVPERNVRSAQEDMRSLIWLYRRLIALRRNEPALTSGTYWPLRSRSDVLMFKRTHANTELLIALNFSASARRFSFEGRAQLLLSTHLDRDPASLSSPSILRENEGAILRLLG
jgi:alpha-glucosidase